MCPDDLTSSWTWYDWGEVYMSHECSLSLPGSHDTRGWMYVLVLPIRTTWSLPQSLVLCGLVENPVCLLVQ